MNSLITISDARASLPELVGKVNRNDDEFIITVYGKPVAKIISANLNKKKSKIDFTEVLKSSSGMLSEIPDTTKDKRSREEKKITLLKWSGVWDNKEGDLIRRNAEHFRKTAKMTR